MTLVYINNLTGEPIFRKGKTHYDAYPNVHTHSKVLTTHTPIVLILFSERNVPNIMAKPSRKYKIRFTWNKH